VGPREHAHRRALEALYVAHERGLYNAAYRYVWSRDDARDVVHDAFVRLWHKREDLDWERAAGLAYTIVIGIARNRRRAFAIRRAFGLGQATAPAASAADEALDDVRLDAAVRRCIDELPERLRSVLVMCQYSGLDHAEIAAALGIAPGTVGSRRNEAIAKIREKLEERGHAA
jgi:RNA polymerase sigma-70 factor (ECF subfamily)